MREVRFSNASKEFHNIILLFSVGNKSIRLLWSHIENEMDARMLLFLKLNQQECNHGCRRLSRVEVLIKIKKWIKDRAPNSPHLNRLHLQSPSNNIKGWLWLKKEGRRRKRKAKMGRRKGERNKVGGRQENKCYVL